MSHSFFTGLPRGIRLAVHARLQLPAFRTLPRNASAWTRHAHNYAHEAASLASRTTRTGRSYFWLFPIAGGFALYLAPHPESVFPALLSSPTIIPCTDDRDREPFPELTINSPDEPRWSVIAFMAAMFRDKVWEPLLTARRFVHLLFLFLPVLLSAPMLLVGKPERVLGGDRRGAVWWYGFLTAQMQCAGPTFVKVRNC